MNGDEVLPTFPGTFLISLSKKKEKKKNQVKLCSKT